MKRKQHETKKQLSTKDREAIDGFIDRALERYSIEDIVFCFLDKIDNWKDREKMIEQLLQDEEVKEDLKSELESEYKQGKIFIQAETMEQETKIMDFLCTSIFPYHNQQQAALFA
jgi:hypothetical protein